MLAADVTGASVQVVLSRRKTDEQHMFAVLTITYRQKLFQLRLAKPFTYFVTFVAIRIS